MQLVDRALVALAATDVYTFTFSG